MKNIVQFNPSINIESHLIGSTDIVLVYKDNEPIGYVHRHDDNKFRLHANFFTDDIIENKTLDDIVNSDEFETLEELIRYYSELQFKLVE